MASPVSQNDEARSSSTHISGHQNCELNSEDIDDGSEKAMFSPGELNSDDIDDGSEKAMFSLANVDSEYVSIPKELDENVLLNSEEVDVNKEGAKSASRSRNKRKKYSSPMKGMRYPLRSSVSGSRVLRSMSNTKSKIQPERVSTQANLVTEGRRKRRKVKKALNDEFSATRKRLRYMLTRMGYEQSLIDAYSGEGWKGQSAEKIRPEKELERAKSEILRCKCKIRELFRQLDSSFSEGRFEDSLFDSEGQIDSEDIFCAKCGSKDTSINNDIVLCDGLCDRGFHQKCLNPPLLSEDVPGDEGWLCPACDCKVDCIDLLNEIGSKISIKDSWEKVFPEAVATINGDEQADDLPSDDSEDHDYNPDGPAVNEEPNSTPAPEDSNSDKQNENFGFPSDDSEDDEFDPDAQNPEESIPKDGSSSDESDFTSDSDEFCAELSKTNGANEDYASSVQNQKPIPQSGEDRCDGDLNHSELPFMSDPGLNQENVLMSAKRQLERLDYKQLYNETYGPSSSDSSDDEDWSESASKKMPNRGKKHANKIESEGPSKASARSMKNHKKSKTAVSIPAEFDMGHEVAEQLPGCEESNGNKSSAAAHRKLGEIATQKLYDSFQENQYPTREKKESLAQELGLTFRQVDKWFGNSRHSFRASAKESASPNMVASRNIENRCMNRGTSKDDNKPDGNIVLSSASKDGERKKSSVSASVTKAEDENDEDGVDMERHKAIARELKKMMKGR